MGVDEQNLTKAKQVFDTICQMLDGDDWHYEKNEDELTVRFGVQGEDIPVQIGIEVQAERQLVVLFSPMPYKIPEEKRLDLAVAVSVANRGMINGTFDYNVMNGNLLFRISNSYIGCDLSTDVFMYMLQCACATVDEYNDKFLMIAKNVLTLEQFIASQNA